MWVEELPNGKYKYVERYEDKHGKERRVSVTHEKKTKRVQAEMYLYLQERIEEKMNALEKTTLEEVIEEFKAVHYQTIKQATRSMCDIHLKLFTDYFSINKSIKKITRADINRYVLFLLNDKKYKRSTVTVYMSSIQLLIKHALVYGYIEDNVTTDLNIPKINLPEDKTWKFLEKNELRYVIDELNKINKKVARFCELLALTGMRFGELAGLDISNHIDLDKKLIRIERTLVASTLRFNSPKNGKTRTIHINERTAQIIKKQIKATRLHALSRGYRTSLLFPNTKGDPLSPSYIHNSLKEIKIEGKKISSHIFRHTFITRMVENNIPPLVIAEHVGHTGTKMIEQVYTHFSNKMNEQSKDMINNIQIM